MILYPCRYGNNVQVVMVLECVKADVAVADGLLDIVAIPPVVLAAVVVENASSAQGKEDTMKLNIDNYIRSTWGTAPLLQDKC